MSFARSIAALLIAFLLSMGGLGGHGMHMAMTANAAPAPGIMALSADDMAMVDHHAGHQNSSQGESDGKSGSRAAPNCCLVACGMVTVLNMPAQLSSTVGWEPLRLQFSTEDDVRGRSVSPLRRPPRSVA